MRRILSLILVLVMASISCVFSSENEAELPCSPPPENFSEDLIFGTWKATVLNEDYLIIQPDGTYKQIVRIDYLDYSYESDWQRWWIEYSDIGRPYLHLEDYRPCVAVFDENCNEAGFGDIGWYDFCEEKWAEAEDKGIVIIMGGQSDNLALKEISLLLFGGYDHTYGYRKLVPQE
jgi:hypothetical protein